MNDLPLLRDIHLPPAITKFPLGYGFLFLLAFFVVCVALTPYFRHLYLKSKKQYTLRLLQNLKQENLGDVCKISEILKRVCKIKHKKAVAFYGDKWADFLKSTTSYKISPELLNVLINAPYAPCDLSIKKTDFEDIKSFARQWVEENL